MSRKDCLKACKLVVEDDAFVSEINTLLEAMGEFEPGDQSRYTGCSDKDVGDVPQPDKEVSGECPFPFIFLHDPA